MDMRNRGIYRSHNRLSIAACMLLMLFHALTGRAQVTVEQTVDSVGILRQRCQVANDIVPLTVAGLPLSL